MALTEENLLLNNGIKSQGNYSKLLILQRELKLLKELLIMIWKLRF